MQGFDKKTTLEFKLFQAVAKLDFLLGNASPGIQKILIQNSSEELIEYCKTYSIREINDFSKLNAEQREDVRLGLIDACASENQRKYSLIPTGKPVGLAETERF